MTSTPLNSKVKTKRQRISRETFSPPLLCQDLRSVVTAICECSDSPKRRKNVNPLLSFPIAALVCKSFECFQQEAEKIWLKKTGFCVPSPHNMVYLVIMDYSLFCPSLPPPTPHTIASVCGSPHRVLRELLFIVRKYKRMSL